MDIVVIIVFTVFVIVVAYFALKQGKEDRGKSYEQRRNETYERYERRMEEFRNTEMKPKDSSDE